MNDMLIMNIILVLLLLLMLLPSKKTKSLSKMMEQMSLVRLDGVREGKSDNIPIFYQQMIKLGELVLPLVNVSYSANVSRRIQSLIQQSGLKKSLRVDDFLAMQVGLGVMMILYSSLLSLLVKGVLSLVLLILIPIGIYYPIIWLKGRINHRKWQIQKELPFVLSSIATLTEAGVEFFQAIKVVCSIRSGVLVDEFSIVVYESNLGLSRKEALERLINRVNVKDLSIFVSACIQSLEKGNAGISDLLSEQADNLWETRKEKARELAEKASIKLFLPMLLLVLPALMIYILSPAGFTIYQYFIK